MTSVTVGRGDVDLAISVNRGQPLLLRNETRTTSSSLTIVLRGRDAVRFGATVEVRAGGRRQTRWWGADVTFLGMHSEEMVFGLGESETAELVRVRWVDGQESRLEKVAPGRVEVLHSER